MAMLMRVCWTAMALASLLGECRAFLPISSFSGMSLQPGKLLSAVDGRGRGAASREAAGTGGVWMGVGPLLVTGASGRTGRLVVKELVGRGHDVRALVRDEAGSSKLADSGAYVVMGDVCKFDELVAAMEGCRACIVCHGSERPTKPVKDMMYKLWDPESVFIGEFPWVALRTTKLMPPAWRRSDSISIYLPFDPYLQIPSLSPSLFV